eukprot:scaffold4347_cov117-Cylindrotheca_fusiformis.AAC.10
MSTVPPSPNPKSGVTMQFLSQLDSLVEVERIEDGRMWFHTDQLSLLIRLDARSVRIVAIQANDTPRDADEVSVKWKSFLCPELSSPRLSRAVAKQLARDFDWKGGGNSDNPTLKFHFLLT